MEQMLRLPKLFGDGCVLQQGMQTRIWGWDEPGQRVRIVLYAEGAQGAGEKGYVTADRQVLGEKKRKMLGLREIYADENGCFEAVFSGLQAGGPYILVVTDQRGQHIEVRDVYVGDVFVCGGQSNMELPMRRVRERFPEEFWNGGAPDVHLYKVQECYDFHAPLSDHVKADWCVCSGEKLSEISAFSYFLGKEMAMLRKIPVGIINLSLGGTPAEAWMSREALEPWPEYLELRQIYQDDVFCRDLMARKEQEEKEWYAEILRQENMWKEENVPRQRKENEDRRGQKAPWIPISLPGRLDDAGIKDFCGCIWLRRTFEVAKDCAGRAGLLRFGTLTDSDRIYINGVLVGETGYCYPPRRYPIPDGLLRPGSNEIQIRLICRNGGGRVTEGKPYDILWEDVCSDSFGGTAPSGQDVLEPISLAGEWEYQVRAVCGPAPEQEFINRRPTGLFQGMVAPCLPYSVRAVVWYQGESNDCRPENYGELLKGMIRDWRKKWRQERLPFVIVQLPNCQTDIAEGDAWPLIREAQRRAGQLEQVAVTVNIDIGEDNDLHPLDKKTAAHRAVLALEGMACEERAGCKEYMDHDSGAECEANMNGNETLDHKSGADCEAGTGCEADTGCRESTECTEKMNCKINMVWKGPEVSGWIVEGSQVRLKFHTGDGGGLILAERERESGKPVPADGRAPACLFELAGNDMVYCPATVSIRGREILLHSDQVQRPCYVRYAWSKAPGRVLLYNESGLCASPFRMKL